MRRNVGSLEELRMTPDHQPARKNDLSPTTARTGFYPNSLILEVDSSPDSADKSPARWYFDLPCENLSREFS